MTLHVPLPPAGGAAASRSSSDDSAQGARPADPHAHGHGHAQTHGHSHGHAAGDHRARSVTPIGPRPAEGRPGPSSPTPPRAELEMPDQDLRRAPPAKFRAQSWRTIGARLVAFGGALALTILGADQMLRAMDTESLNTLQIALRALFVITFGWIALAACAALAGLLFAPRAPKTDASRPLTTRTAILMPVYNEDAAASAGALAAMARGLADLGHGRNFEIFVISDSRDPDVWVEETTAVEALRQELGGAIPVWYRRRPHNVARKAGNVQDFVEKWGGRYDFFLSLDADSLMSAETIAEMVRRMEARPRLGLLQTNPALAFGSTPFARLQQFAGALYGPVVARGVAAWQGTDGNYWGHNALIRTRAFAASAGLPELHGRKPFGGYVLSHDFVEAALLRRAGWEVRMDPDLGGSWEGAPPSLLAAAVRDRRWAQGNLQHAKIIGARGLRWPNRVHFAIGIGSYLMSPIWLMMICVGLVLTAQAAWFRPEYFPQGFQLFPSWPRFDSERMLTLFWVSMALLLTPKFVGVLTAVASRRRRRQLGGAFRIVWGAMAEIVLSALAAPAMMMMQSRHVFDILMGRDAGWTPQEREGAALPWRMALAAHWGHVSIGAVLAVALWLTAPEVLIWLSPVLLGLVLSPLVSRLSGDPKVGALLRRLRLFDTGPDLHVPRAAREAEAAEDRIRAALAGALPALLESPERFEAHASGVDATLEDEAEDQTRRLAKITAAAKIEAASGPLEALEWMTKEERTALAADRHLLEAWRACGAAAEPTQRAAE